MNERKEDHPHDKLTKIGNAALSAIPDEAGLTAIVIITLGNRSGIAIGGYPINDDVEIMADMIRNLKAIAKVNGLEMRIVVGGKEF